MKKLMTLALGLAFALGTVATTVSFAQETPKKDEKKAPKKKGGKKKEETPKKDGGK
jgi:hypothetical protein